MIAEQLGLKKPLIFEIPNILNEAECHQWIAEDGEETYCDGLSERTFLR